MPQSATSSQRVTARERELEALEMRKAGWSYAKIGEALCITPIGAHKAVMRVLERMTQQAAEDAAKVRQIELERLDELWQIAWESAIDGDLKAIETCLKIQERRSKFQGLDAAQKVDLSGTVGIRQYEGVNVDDV
jgi:hypothetical protein